MIMEEMPKMRGPNTYARLNFMKTKRLKEKNLLRKENKGEIERSRPRKIQPMDDEKPIHHASSDTIELTASNK